MKIAIAGTGKVGCSIASELADNGHQILVIDRDPSAFAELPAGIDHIIGDACELSVLERADVQSCQVVVAATGDDKANLVVSLLAKTEFGVPRVVARVNHPDNEWMFNEGWGVDVSVSTPRILSALVEEAVSVGDVVRLFGLRSGNANLVELTLPEDSPVATHTVGSIAWPVDCVLVTIVRGQRSISPSADDTIEAGDELLMVCSPDSESALQELLSPHRH
ncbi:MAG TPA: potassium transporter TrkA [Actinobacteria bacterium]|nr:potassium transporter TrkA [Actinomycetota bacterium]